MTRFLLITIYIINLRKQLLVSTSRFPTFRVLSPQTRETGSLITKRAPNYFPSTRNSFSQEGIALF